MVKHSQNYECVLLKVCYGRFQSLVSVLFSDDRSSTHQIQTRFGGNFATVFKASILRDSVAIKCTRFSNATFAEVFGDVLKEYIIFKVLSQLKIGPKVEKKMGFDIIVGFECIEFCL